METILNIGNPAKGFKFESGKYKTSENFNLTYNQSMNSYIGKIGIITDINENLFAIEFKDGAKWSYPLSLMHLAVVEEPQVIEIDMSKVEKFEAFNGKEWCNKSSEYLKYRFTMKDENKLKIKQEIKELKEKIKELKSKL